MNVKLYYNKIIFNEINFDALMDLNGFVKKKIYSLNNIYPKTLINTIDQELTSFGINLEIQYGIVKNNSRNKRKIFKYHLRYNLISNDFIINNALDFKLKKYIINSDLFNPKLKIQNSISIPIHEQIFPLQIKSRKMKTPCGTSLQYFKNYLQYIKNLTDEELVKKVKLKFYLSDYLINKYIKLIKFPNFKKHKYDIFDLNKHVNLLIRYHFQFYNEYINICYGEHFHKLIPLIHLTCPCFINDDNNCKKTIDIELFILLLKLYSDNYYINNFIKFIYIDFIIPIIKRFISINNNSYDVTTTTIRKIVINRRNYFKCREKISLIHHQITNVRCESCYREHICCTYKLSKNFIKRNNIMIKYSYNCDKNQHHKCCAKCGNFTTKHKGKKCPKPINVIRPTSQEINEIRNALNNENIELAKCPNCDNIATKDDNCDKVRCGAIDGGRRDGCGTQFCFRCGDDLSNLRENYLQHLITTMKPDKTQTQWICKKFAIDCPTCNIKQYWDGISDKIMCGECNIKFDYYS